MKLLVLGAGYVGMALLGYLRNRGYEICVTTTQAGRIEALKSCADSVFLLGADDKEGFNALLASCEGAVILVAPKPGSTYEEVYLHTAKRVACALKAREEPFYILYTSSTSVYEGVECEWATEELSLVPRSAKASILLKTEKILLGCADTCVLRLGGIFGPDREISKRAGYFSGKEVPGAGDEPTNHIYLDDIVLAIAFCLEKRVCGIYNVVNDEHPTRRELYSSLCRSLSLPLPKWDSSLPPDKKGYKVSNRKLVAAGFTPSLTPLK